MSAPGLAAITLDARGGGIAAVSRLLWRVMRDEWGPACQLKTLVSDRATSLETAIPQRMAFGARMAWAQATRQCRWVLYSHLAVARAQAYIPMAARRPYAVFLHGIEAWGQLTPSQAGALRGATALLVNSLHTAQRVSTAHPWLPSPAVCPLALEPGPGASVRGRDREVPWGPRAVLLVGRMAAAERYKGHDELLEAWPQVVAAVPDARLVFVGDGDDLPRLRERAQTLGVGHSFVTTGFVTGAQRDEAYENAAVFAMPSRGEGFGLVYLEAMSHGLACVGSREDAASEVIDDGVSGFLVKQSDTLDLADRLVRLLRDDSLRRDMGQRGRQRVIDRFSYAAFRRQVVATLDRAFHEPRVGSVLSTEAD